MAARMDTSAFAEPMDDVPLPDELRASIEEHFVTPRRDTIRRILERPRAAGEIREDIDLELAGPVPSAIIYQRLLITHEPVDDTLPERIVDELMLPLLT